MGDKGRLKGEGLRRAGLARELRCERGRDADRVRERGRDADRVRERGRDADRDLDLDLDLDDRRGNAAGDRKPGKGESKVGKEGDLDRDGRGEAAGEPGGPCGEGSPTIICP